MKSEYALTNAVCLQGVSQEATVIGAAERKRQAIITKSTISTKQINSNLQARIYLLLVA